MRLLALAVLFAAAPAALAQQPTRSGDPHAAAPVVGAVRASGPVRIDGKLDEAAWSAATAATGFTQLEPAEGQPGSERTEVRVLFDDEALYVGVRLHDSAPVSTRLGRRDMSLEASDWLTVILDSYHDHRTAFGLELNPSGVRRDQTRGDAREDDSWDPVWQAQTSIDSAGWSAEMRIPFSQLRFNAAPSQTWGIQVERQIARKNEFAVLAFTPRSQPGGIPRFAHLTGLNDVRTGKRLEILPYTVLKAEHVERGPNPFREDR
ncbi:MAG: carbohydrate binding family 9 domain-containing protein, partial [Gemmatimonadetes bacterium]|nr:carbohydrate binding family 9 domain-containing protein [Gemmatimonadota bacterium]